MNNSIFIITGPQGSGKTTFLVRLVRLLKKEGVAVGGFVAHGFWKDDRRNRFELEDLQNGKKTILSQTEAVEGWEKFRRFYFNPDGFAFGEKILSPDNLQNVEIIVIDEIGPFELQGKAWRKSIDTLLRETNKPMIWVCRESILKELVVEFDLQDYHIINISNETPENLFPGIIAKLS